MSEEMQAPTMSYTKFGHSQGSQAAHLAGNSPVEFVTSMDTGMLQALDRAAKAAGLEHVSTPTFRQSYRAWLSQIGTNVDVTKQCAFHDRDDDGSFMALRWGMKRARRLRRSLSSYSTTMEHKSG